MAPAKTRECLEHARDPASPHAPLARPGSQEGESTARSNRAVVIAEVHRANMTKLGPDGRAVRRADGKVLKGDHYRAPDVGEILRRQGWGPAAV